MLGKNLNIKELSWMEAKSIIKKTRPELYQALEEVQPSSEYTFIKATYAYGSYIRKDGMTYLPTVNGDTVPLTHASVPASIRDSLVNELSPLGLVLNKAVEIYFEAPERIVPSAIKKTGYFFGVWPFFDELYNLNSRRFNQWTLTAGARSIFMLPSISDAHGHAKIQRDLGITKRAPKELGEHHGVFKEIAKRHIQDPKHSWQCEVLFFTKKWTTNINAPHMLPLKMYWLSIAWQQSAKCRLQLDNNIAWEAYIHEVRDQGVKAGPYVINTIKHLSALRDGSYPGFAVAQNEDCIPLNLIQECYINSYLLKDYCPLIIEPRLLNKANPCSIYYSLSFPTLLEWAPRSRVANNLLNDMRELKLLANIYETTLQENNLFEYFHNEEDCLGEIKYTGLLPKLDISFVCTHKFKNNCDFSENSIFLRGCIKINPRPNIYNLKSTYAARHGGASAAPSSSR